MSQAAWVCTLDSCQAVLHGLLLEVLSVTVAPAALIWATGCFLLPHKNTASCSFSLQLLEAPLQFDHNHDWVAIRCLQDVLDLIQMPYQIVSNVRLCVVQKCARRKDI